MKKILFTLAASMALLTAAPAAAQQSNEEARDSIKQIIAQAYKGDAVSQNTLGLWYYKGKHVDQSFTKAREWWEKSGKQNNALAIGNLGWLVQHGEGIKADSLMAAKLYLKSFSIGNPTMMKRLDRMAQEGNTFANMLIATCYLDGKGVAKNPEKAIPYLTRAAKSGSIEGQRSLALAYMNDDGQASKAAPWFRKAADAGDIPSCYYIGRMLVEGMGVKANPEEGAGYLTRAASRKHANALNYLGDMSLAGNGVEKDETRAVKMYRSAAGLGNILAQWSLAECYRKGVGTEPDFEEATVWYAKSGTRGKQRSFKQFADSLPNDNYVIYLKGLKAYSDKDFKTALDLMKKLGKGKVVDGDVMQAVILADKNNPDANPKKAYKMLEKLAASPRALFLLGQMTEAGNGTEKDPAKAMEYFVKAADAEYAPALCLLGNLYFNGSGVEKNYTTALEYLSKAEAAGRLSKDAAAILAECYEHGLGGVAIDADKAAALRKRTDIPDINGWVNAIIK